MPTQSSSFSSIELPQRTEVYIGRRTDSRRWDQFSARDDDVFICTPPKCGTTWTQAICAMLIFARADFDGKIGDISPWIDAKMVSIEACMQTLNAQTHRRFIKTHTPLDGITHFATSQYLLVYRDPRDAYFSMRNHMNNARDSPMLPEMADDPCEGFRVWLDTPFEPGVGEQRSLAAFVHHYESFRRFRERANFHFFHYADYKRALRSSFTRIADTLGIERSNAILDELSAAATFDNMKAKSTTYAPGAGLGIWKDDTAFFNKGQNAQWRDVLGSAELEHYAQRMGELLAAEDIAWLENGSG
jgi:aryl sulfotransferase